MQLSELKQLHVTQLVEMAVENEIEGANRLRKLELVFALLKNRAKKGEAIFGDGTLEVLPDGFGFLRAPDTSYLASTDDIYVSPSQIRRFNLHTGDSIEGEIRIPKEGERYFALVKVDKVNGGAPELAKAKILFENLTPLHPDEHLHLERDIKAEENITGRIIDIIAPIGKGQRGMIVAQPKTGKTMFLKEVANAIAANHPECYLMIVLVDEQDNEVGLMEKMEVHRKALLHRAFSVFIFNSQGEMMLQRRTLGKYHSGGLWTNSCCSHPYPSETIVVAAKRRLFQEMGFTTEVKPIFHFIYKANLDNELTEYEYDHVLIGDYDGAVEINPAEVGDYCFRTMHDIKNELISHPQKYTAWFHIAFPMLYDFLEKGNNVKDAE